MNNERLVITADEAASLLPEGEYIHNYSNPGAGMLIGCDYSREDALKTLRRAAGIEIAGEQAKGMGHPIAVWRPEGGVTFFAADMAKVDAFEAQRAQPAVAAHEDQGRVG